MEFWKRDVSESHRGSNLKKTDRNTWLCVADETDGHIVAEFGNAEAALAYLNGIAVDSLGRVPMSHDACMRYDRRLSEARSLSGDGLVECRLDNCNFEYGAGGLKALVDPEGTKRRPYGLAVAYFPAESARRIAEYSLDPMVGDDPIYWSGDSLVQTFRDEGRIEVDYVIPPVIIDGEPYWRVGEDYLWELLDGPDELLDIMLSTSGGGMSDLEAAARASSIALDDGKAAKTQPSSRDI